MYSYVGAKHILEKVDPAYTGTIITGKADIQNWINQTQQKSNEYEEVIATFIIDLQHRIRINDRHSEHVVCANGQSVLSAGEITFELNKKEVLRISGITNQSTGYCPSPKSWKDVKKALKHFDLPYPEGFTQSFIFRVCKNCDWVNIVKDEIYECGVCESELEV